MRDTGPKGHVALLCTEDTLGKAITHSLAREGRRLTHCSFEAGTVADLQAACPDVIVVQATTTNADALGLCQKIRQTPALDNTKLLLLQNSGRAIDKRRARAMGADGFLSLPFPMSSLRDEVGRLLES